MTRVIVIGAGFGGLAVALRLAVAGYQVTVLEALPEIGGRARSLVLGPYRFDTGPTLLTLPSLFEELWQLAGADFAEDVRLVRLSPFYRIYFADGERFDCWGDEERDCEEVRRFDPDAPDQYRRFLQATGEIYRRAFDQLAKEPFDRLSAFLAIVPELLRLRAHESVYRFTSRFFREPRLRMAFSFHPLFIGGNPLRASAIYSIIPYLERREGVFFAQGGMAAVVRALAHLLSRCGVEIRTDSPVTRIHTQHGRVCGVEVGDSEYLPADVVVANSDVATTVLELLPEEERPRLLSMLLTRARYSMSCYLLYLGLRRQYEYLAHHTIIMPLDYEHQLRELFDGDGTLSELAFYLHAPARTDPSFAPPGQESLYVLVPVPHLGRLNAWGSENRARFRERVLSTLEHLHGFHGLTHAIEAWHEFTPSDFALRLRSFLGAAFSLEPTLLQSAYFRPHNRSPLRGLYFVGAGTHPGAGIPGVLLSAAVTARVVARDVPLPSSSRSTLIVTAGEQR